jgi:hypothetical protein
MPVGGPRPGTQASDKSDTGYDFAQLVLRPVFLTFGPKMPSFIEPEDKAGGCVVRATNSTQLAYAFYVRTSALPFLFSLSM